jgi:peptide deformylase
MQRRILQITDPNDQEILRRPAQWVSPELLHSDAFKDLVADMKETMRQAPGVGLAAPQIGAPFQVVVIEDCEERQTGLTPEIRRERGRAIVPFHVLINPVIKVASVNRISFFEGCLSVKGRLRVTPRAEMVTVDYQDEQGSLKTIQARGWYARILQHEIEHVNGRLYIDVGDPTTEIPITNETVARWINAPHHEITLFQTECHSRSTAQHAAAKPAVQKPNWRRKRR